MIVLNARNVNHLLALGADHLAHAGVREDSRAGPVVVAPTPVCSVYESPCERVLFSARRDANPFFHLHESLWMLAGRDDAESLNRYVKDFGDRFAEPNDGRIHGAYGHRWRSALGFDQLDGVVAKLKKNPQDRQCVIQMWDARTELVHNYTEDGGERDDHYGENDFASLWRDRPCNTHVYLRVQKQKAPYVEGAAFFSSLKVPVLDLTVLCRSNDIVWGAYGANAVHFSMLHEYLAGRIGVGVGTMYQFSNNFHGYVDALDRLGDPRLLFEEEDSYEHWDIVPQPIGDDWEHWDEDVRHYMDWHDNGLWRENPGSNDISPPDGFYNMNFFVGTAGVMAACNWLWKNNRRAEALEYVSTVDAMDWRLAAFSWMKRRASK